MALAELGLGLMLSAEACAASDLGLADGVVDPTAQQQGRGHGMLGGLDARRLRKPLEGRRRVPGEVLQLGAGEGRHAPGFLTLSMIGLRILGSVARPPRCTSRAKRPARPRPWATSWWARGLQPVANRPRVFPSPAD